MATWTTPQYSREEVDWAGAQLLKTFTSEDDFDRAIAIVNNWRSSHSFPLNTFQNTLRRNARLVARRPTIAQRIKRLSSIKAKLERFPKLITLSVMQDLGGCRAVVGSVNGVRRLAGIYKRSDLRHELVDEDDYIAEPKKSGYRGVHLIYRYQSDKKHAWDGLKIEMQLRSPLQHAWATAVETVGTFTGQALKSSAGSDDWRRFFKLMGSAIARQERSPLVPGTPATKRELVSELRALAASLDVENRLQAYRRTVAEFGGLEAAGAHFFLLELQIEEGRLGITGFRRGDRELAEIAYGAAETAIREKGRGDAVLVSVESVAALRRAYPNYYLDARAFIRAMRRALSH